MENKPKPLAVVKFLAPKVPRMITDATVHSLGLAKTSGKWDLKTTMIISVIRSIMNDPSPQAVSKQQQQSMRDPGIKGQLWISKQTLPRPEAGATTDVVDQVEGAIHALAADENQKAYARPEILPVEVEWTGFRPDADKNTPRPDLSENEQYKRLVRSSKSDVTILYIHGGALYLLDPCTHRTTCSRLAKHSGGRCMSVRYRLAPQNPFPAALLDVFVAYLSLLSPPPGAVHEPVAAKNIVFAGDSAGGTLSFALLQLILQLHRSSNGGVPTVQFHGRPVQVGMPAGVAVMSPWTDLTRSLPSIQNNAKFDYLPPANDNPTDIYTPDESWPANPPRGDLYCETSMLMHPLVNPLAATNWTNAPPTFICVGEECLTDEGKVMARRLANEGSKVEFLEFEAMPHVFPAIFADMPGAQMAMRRWGDAAKRMVEEPLSFKTEGEWVQAKTLEEKELPVAELLPELPDEVVASRMREAQSRRGSADERYTARL